MGQRRLLVCPRIYPLPCPALQVPDELGHLTNLVRLSLHINQLTSLPASMGNLVHLEAL